MMDLRTPEERLAAAGGTTIRYAPPRVHAPLPVTLFRDIAPVVDGNDFVQGVLVERSAAMIYGRSNSGKTFLATDLALHVAAGIKWNGRRVEQGGVVYCPLEGGNGFRNRVAAWRREHGLEGVEIPFAAVEAPINLLHPAADAEKLVETVKATAKTLAVPVKLIVIDTLSRALAGGNENAPDDMGALVKSIDRIRHDTDAAVLLIHHSGKDDAKGARGHTLLVAAIDTEIEVTDQNGERTATVTKQRDLRKGDVFNFTLRTVDIGVNRHGEAVTTCVVEHGEVGTARSRKPKLTASEQKARRILADVIATEGTPLPATDGFPSGLLGVPEARWRDECDSRRVCTADTRKVRTQAFRRAFTGLLNSGEVAARDDLVWLTNPASAEQEGFA